MSGFVCLLLGVLVGALLVPMLGVVYTYALSLSRHRYGVMVAPGELVRYWSGPVPVGRGWRWVARAACADLWNVPAAVYRRFLYPQRGH